MGGTTHRLREDRSRPVGTGRASIALGVLVAAALVAGSTAAAGPGDWGYTGGGDQTRAPDSRDHWHCKANFDLHHDWLDSAMEQLDVQTVMYRQDAGSCGSSTDVVWVKTALGGIDGGEYTSRTLCATHVSWGVCDQFWVQVDQPWYFLAAFSYGASDPGGWYSRNLQATLRHEVGRTAGLHPYEGNLNPGYGAMNQATIPNGTPGWLAYLAYTSTHVNLIDGHL